MDHRNCLAFIMAVFMLFAVACNSGNTGTPFPDQYNYTRPLVQPLQFTPEKKLQWTITKQGGINPVVKTLDLDALPSVPYDSNGFKPMNPLPVTISIDSLSETAFISPDTSRSIIFKTSVLPAPALIKSAPPSPVTSSDMALYDFGALQGYQGKVTTCFIQDHNGLIWIGSTAGIDCYDGENVKNYPVIGGNDVIVGITEDRSGRMWAISTTGIMMIDPAKNTIARSNQVIGLNNTLSPMTLDHNGNIIASDIVDSGFVIIDPSSLTYKHITSKNGLSDNNVYQVVEVKNNNYWAATAKGIDIIQRAGTIKHFQKSNGLNIDSYAPLLQDDNGNIWTGWNGRLEFINMQANTITHYGPFAQIKDGFILKLAQDKKGRIWAATTSGIFIVDTTTQTIKYIHVKQGTKDDVSISILRDSKGKLWIGTRAGINIIEQNGDMVYPIPRKQVAASFQQQDGKIWIGSSGAGIEIIDRQEKHIAKLTAANGISSDFIQSIQQHGKSIWITSNAGLDMLDINKKTITHIGKKEGLANNIVYTAARSTTGDIWLTGPTGGLDVIDSGMTTIKHLGIREGLSDSNVVDVKPDANGLIWVATAGGGVDIIDPVKQTIKYINDVKALKGASNKVLFADAANNMWIATNKGICIADNTKRTVTTLTTAQGLSNNHITSLSAYKSGVVAGAATGVNIIMPPAAADDATAWKINTLTNSDGLTKINNSWATDLVTREGEFWWCDNGVTIINEISPSNDSAVTFVTGLTVMNQSRFFVSKTVLGDKDTLWGVDTFYTEDRTTPLEATAYRQGLSWDSIAGPYNMPGNLRIPYNQNYLQFHFAQASLGRQDTVWYTYMLEGIDKQWSPLTNKSTSENYLNLPPGTYTFKVKSKGLNGVWGSAPDFTFIITPPWWATWWFRVLSVVALIIVIYAIVKERSKKLKAENLRLEQKVAERTAQLKRSLDELKATQGQLIYSEKMASLGELTAGIAHEIQNPLNFVNNFSEVNKEMIAELKEELNKANYNDAKLIANDIEANEEKINYHGKRADSIVKGMLQHSRANTGQKEPTDINALCDEFLRLSYHGLRAKDKSFNAEFKTDFDANIGKINVVPQDIGRVLLNVFNNAFYAVNEKKKTADEDYTPTVSVITKRINSPLEPAPNSLRGAGGIEITVADNGNGIPQQIVDKIFQPFFTTKPTGQGTGLGLSLAYDVIKVHGGEIKVETKGGEGSEFTIWLPIG